MYNIHIENLPENYTYEINKRKKNIDVSKEQYISIKLIELSESIPERKADLNGIQIGKL